jgi:hypothetical protein
LALSQYSWILGNNHAENERAKRDNLPGELSKRDTRRQIQRSWRAELAIFAERPRDTEK